MNALMDEERKRQKKNPKKIKRCGGQFRPEKYLIRRKGKRIKAISEEIIA